METESIRKLKWAKPSRHGLDQVRFLPEPERRLRHYPIVSVDDHLIEPRDIFEGRIPAKWKHRAPRLVEHDDGSEAWMFEGIINTSIGMSALAGRPIEECAFEPQ